jgi:hypothetical protein
MDGEPQLAGAHGERMVASGRPLRYAEACSAPRPLVKKRTMGLREFWGTEDSSDPDAVDSFLSASTALRNNQI